MKVEGKRMKEGTNQGKSRLLKVNQGSRWNAECGTREPSRVKVGQTKTARFFWREWLSGWPGIIGWGRLDGSREHAGSGDRRSNQGYSRPFKATEGTKSLSAEGWQGGEGAGGRFTADSGLATRCGWGQPRSGGREICFRCWCASDIQNPLCVSSFLQLYCPCWSACWATSPKRPPTN